MESPALTAISHSLTPAAAAATNPAAPCQPQGAFRALAKRPASATANQAEHTLTRLLTAGQATDGGQHMNWLRAPGGRRRARKQQTGIQALRAQRRRVAAGQQHVRGAVCIGGGGRRGGRRRRVAQPHGVRRRNQHRAPARRDVRGDGHAARARAAAAASGSRMPQPRFHIHTRY